jgi:hypothetical protein
MKRDTPAVCARLVGGLGNQMFIYAAARTLAIRSGARLVLDSRSGFKTDDRYRRTFQLGGCRLPRQVVSDMNSIPSPSGPKRRILRLINRSLPFGLRRWIAESGRGCDARLTGLRVSGTVWLEGYWQDERYFAEHADMIRYELMPNPATDPVSLRVKSEIACSDAIAIHLRLDTPPTSDVPLEVLVGYYRQAIRRAIDLAPTARLFAFSDRPEAAERLLRQIGASATFVSRGEAGEAPLADLWLMSLCRTLVLAPSTYSWWAAWLSDGVDRTRIAPNLNSGWQFGKLIRSSWITIRGS